MTIQPTLTSTWSLNLEKTDLLKKDLVLSKDLVLNIEKKLKER